MNGFEVFRHFSVLIWLIEYLVSNRWNYGVIKNGYEWWIWWWGGGCVYTGRSIGILYSNKIIVSIFAMNFLSVKAILPPSHPLTYIYNS